MEIDAVECPDHPGYYEIPGHSKYGVKPCGTVISKKSGYVHGGSINPAGYLNVTLFNDSGRHHTWGRHRLLGLVFKNPGVPIEKLVINHLDGVKANLDLPNLEWTTQKGNIEHAGATGLSQKCLPISTRNVDTGEIQDFPSYAECGRAFGMTCDAISYRMRFGQTRIFPERQQYRHGFCEDPWYIPTNIEKELLVNSTSKSIQMRCLRTGDVHQFEKASQLADYICLSPSVIVRWIEMENQPVLPGLIQIKWTLDNSPWRDVEDPYLELDQNTGRRCVKTFDTETDKITVYTTAASCARACGLSVTTLDYRLKAGAGKIYSDGLMYAYYTNEF